MTMGVSATIKIGDTIELPALDVRFPHAIGVVRHQLQPSVSATVTKIDPVNVSERRSELLYTLNGGQRVIMAGRKVSRPSKADGVLMRSKNDQLRWVSHRLQDDFTSDVIAKGLPAVAREISSSWKGQFSFRAEVVDASGAPVEPGLRPPQIGGLHAIGSHWSLYRQAATVVMPTGTGKTETMLASLVAFQPGLMVLAVPSEVLREQTAAKFITLGLLRKLGNLSAASRNPIVGVLKRRPKTAAELDFFDQCNVVVGTMSALGEGTAEAHAPAIASKTGVLVVDEAHHIPATGWTEFKDRFADHRVLQFTATPYRRDGKLVEGKVIFDYPLHLAQRDGYFKSIKFIAVYQIDQEEADKEIAGTAIEVLRGDLNAGKDHLLMARCDRIERGKELLSIYEKQAADLSPVLVHSESRDTDQALEAIRDRRSRVVIAVNMLGEGFDLPQLKVAAVHDAHKSLAVLLQFTGRFTRSAGKNIGDASVIANIADPSVSGALERLYSEDADWNQLLSELSSSAAKSHMALTKFLNESQRLDKPVDDEKVEISHHLLRPGFNTVMYNAEKFTPKAFFKGMPSGVRIHRVWLHAESKTLYFVTRVEPAIQWTRSRALRDRQWDLFVLHFDEEQKLLFLSSSDKSSVHTGLAHSVGANSLIFGDEIFRSLGRINRLVFQNVGVKKHGRRNLRFAMYTGSDVAEALSISEKAGSVKSNVSGTGWESGEQISIGCSYKGRVWTREPGTIPEFVKWARHVGKKVLDNTIDTKDIIANVLIPKEVTTLPDRPILSVEWPLEILRQMEERVVLTRGSEDQPISMFDLEFVSSDPAANQLRLHVKSVSGEVWADLTMTVDSKHGYEFTDAVKSQASIRIGKLTDTIASFLNSYPPLVRFVDLTELDGNILLEPQHLNLSSYPDDRFESWDWTGVDVTRESIWKGGSERKDSIQWCVAQHYLGEKYDVVFDDDAPGEAGDLICLKEDEDHIRLSIVHCKFTTGTTAGERVKDVQDVCAQAVRSAKWKGQFQDLARHIVGREKRLTTALRPTRFLAGDFIKVNQLTKAARFKEVRLEVVIVQPGLSKKGHTSDQAAVLGAADSYLKETVGIDLDVISSD